MNISLKITATREGGYRIFINRANGVDPCYAINVKRLYLSVTRALESVVYSLIAENAYECNVSYVFQRITAISLNSKGSLECEDVPPSG